MIKLGPMSQRASTNTFTAAYFISLTTQCGETTALGELRGSDECARLWRIEFPLKVSAVTTLSSIRMYNEKSLKIQEVLIDHMEALVVRVFFHP